MKIMLSIATSADHYIDDATDVRLKLSTPSDWEQIYALRADYDAILVGGETLRRDNPTLGLKSDELISRRVADGREAEPVRVVVSGRGGISPHSKIFHRGAGRVVIFSNIERPELLGVADVVIAESIDVPLIITELEKRGVELLFVEGGAKILSLFLSSGMVDLLRVAVNPNIVVGECDAAHFELPQWIEEMECSRGNLDGMEINTYSLKSQSKPTDMDIIYMRRAVDVSLQSPPKDSCYRVGAVIVTSQGDIFDGYTLETAPTHHAEQAAIYKALEAGADLRGATIYASMEPCSSRNSEPESCSELIIRYGFKRAIFALYEPSHFVECHGAENMRRAGVDVLSMPTFAAEVRRINDHVL